MRDHYMKCAVVCLVFCIVGVISCKYRLDRIERTQSEIMQKINEVGK